MRRAAAVSVSVAMGAVLAGGCGEERAARQQGTTQIAFTAAESGRGSVVVVSADGRDRTRLESGARSPAWSPDGRRLAFVLERDGEDSDIAVMDADGSAVRAVTSGAGQDRDPAFSPDGEWIAFMRQDSRGDGPVHATIQVVKADGSGLRPLTSGALDLQPAWSPDGRRVAFTRMTVQGERLVTHVYVAEVAGNGERKLVEGRAPAWAPDGRRLVYVSGRDRFGQTCFSDCTPSGEIHVVGADGRGDRRLTRSRADDGDPVWAADGRQILFASDRSDPERHDRELYAMTAAGDCVTRLTSASSWSSEPAWRPGGAGRAACRRDGVAAGARRALVDVGLRPARAFSAYPLYWLGRSHRGLLLSHAERFSEGFGDWFSFIYDDCETSRGAGCARDDVQIQNLRLCWWKGGPAPVRLRRIGRERGAPVYTFDGPGSGAVTTAEVHTGETAVRLHAGSERALRRALRALRPLDGEPGARLRPPAHRCQRG